tara:strand:+ start:89 stop:742 length:654 start_codon:yes stop_codon:yes gene_type:complete
MEKVKIDHYYKDVQGWFTFPILYSWIVDKLKDNSHIVEVGAWLGQSVTYMGVEIINSGKTIKFDCVDTWEGSSECVNEDGLLEFIWIKHDEKGNEIFNEKYIWTADQLYNKFLDNIKPLEHVVNPIKSTSIEAATLYDDKSLDFVFIDAGHDFDNVKADIEAWLPKVKNGGYIAGHDYSWDTEVQRAVHSVFPTIDYESEGCWVVEINNKVDLITKF